MELRYKQIRFYVMLCYVNKWDHYTFLGNCLPTPPLTQHFALREK